MRSFIKNLKTSSRVLIGVLLIVLYNGTAKLYYPESIILGCIVAVIFLAFLILCLTNKYEDSGKKSQSTEQPQEYVKRAKGLHDETELDRLATEGKGSAEAGRADVLDKQNAPECGRIFTKVVGVTFNNEDGSSRQKYLREAYAAPYGDVTLKQYEFEGEPAIWVMFDDWCIGNIPRKDVPKIVPILDKITRIDLTISDNDFDNDEFQDDLDGDFEDDRPSRRKGRKDLIYSATIVINYIKEAE